MYLFIFGKNANGISDFVVIESRDMQDVFVSFYDYVGGHFAIDKATFRKMIDNLSLIESANVFNALCQNCKIEMIYTGLSVAYESNTSAMDNAR